MMEVNPPSSSLTDRGAGLAEYAILLLLIAIACTTILVTLGTTISDMLSQAASMF